MKYSINILSRAIKNICIGKSIREIESQAKMACSRKRKFGIPSVEIIGRG